jgi:hypothetical protein
MYLYNVEREMCNISHASAATKKSLFVLHSLSEIGCHLSITVRNSFMTGLKKIIHFLQDQACFPWQPRQGNIDISLSTLHPETRPCVSSKSILQSKRSFEN